MVTRVNALAGQLPDGQRADFQHQAYLKVARAVLVWTDSSAFEADEPDETDEETKRMVEYMQEHRSRRSGLLERIYGVEVPAGFGAPEDPARKFVIGERGQAPADPKLPPPLSVAARLQLHLPEAGVFIREETEGRTGQPVEFKLADALTAEERAVDRTEDTLHQFGIRLDLIRRALGLEQIEPDVVLTVV